MKEERFFYVPDAGSADELPASEAVHALRVLRLHEGDEMFLMDGKGAFYRAEVTLATSKCCRYAISEVLPQQPLWRGKIHLAVAPTKMMERMEWMVEKAVEIGADEFSFLNCAFSERHELRIDRIEKIVVAAMKQSRKPWKPVVNPMMRFGAFLDADRPGRKCIAHCYDELEREDFFNKIMQPSTDSPDITILIGPEGDFSVDEVREAMFKGYEPVSLGNSRLRTETAGVVAVTEARIARRS